MSRVGKRITIVPQGVSVSLKDNVFYAEGKEGKLDMKLSKDVNVSIDNDRIVVTPSSEPTPMWGTTVALISNMIEGVHKGFQKNLNLVGIGYRAQLVKDTLVLKLAYSHEITVKIPQGISVKVPEQTVIQIFGAVKQQVTQFASEVRSLRAINRYKATGILYDGEVIIKKEGKKK